MSNNNTVMDPAFVSVDLESSLGIIRDETLVSNRQGSFVSQSTSREEPSEASLETLPMFMDNNQKVTRTSATYPFANRLQQQPETNMEDDNEDDDDDGDAMDESDSPVQERNDKTTSLTLPTSPQTASLSSSFEPIPVGDEADDLSMLLQDEDAKQVLANRIGDWTGHSTEPNLQQNENGYNIVPPNENWVNIDLSETEVEEDEESLLCMLEEEAKEPGFVLEDIGDRQSFWNNGGNE